MKRTKMHNVEKNKLKSLLPENGKIIYTKTARYCGFIVVV